MQAIVTRIIPATNTKLRRIKAYCKRGSITLKADALLVDQTSSIHRHAAQALCNKFYKEDHLKDFTWQHPFITGELPNGDCVHVFFK